MSIYLSPECEEIIRVALAERDYQRIQELRDALSGDYVSIELLGVPPDSNVVPSFDDADVIRAAGLGVRL